MKGYLTVVPRILKRKTKGIQFKHSLPWLLVVGTTILTATYWHLGMAGITTFLLAYVSKGMRQNR
jgi:hypothetical protein